MNRPWLVSLVTGCFAAAVTSVFYIDLCNLIYQCGCDHLWGAMATRCNVHNATGRHCPWCSVSLGRYGVLFGGIIVVQLALGFFPRRWHWSRRLAAALAAFPVLGAIEGVLLGITTGYWN
jgi:hypothetical protein